MFQQQTVEPTLIFYILKGEKSTIKTMQTRESGVSPCATVLWELCTQTRPSRLNPERLFSRDAPFWKQTGRTFHDIAARRVLVVRLAAAWTHLWYVMEKARLVLVREKRALATPLDVGSQDSVTPVSTATKSAAGKEHQTHARLLVSHTCACWYSPVRLSSEPTSSELR